MSDCFLLVSPVADSADFFVRFGLGFIGVPRLQQDIHCSATPPEMAIAKPAIASEWEAASKTGVRRPCG